MVVEGETRGRLLQNGGIEDPVLVSVVLRIHGDDWIDEESITIVSRANALSQKGMKTDKTKNVLACVSFAKDLHRRREVLDVGKQVHVGSVSSCAEQRLFHKRNRGRTDDMQGYRRVVFRNMDWICVSRN